MLDLNLSRKCIILYYLVLDYMNSIVHFEFGSRLWEWIYEIVVRTAAAAPQND